MPLFRHVDKADRERVLALFKKVSQLNKKADAAATAFESMARTQPADIRSPAFEEAYSAAISATAEAGIEVGNPTFWPDLNDVTGRFLLVEFRLMTQECYYRNFRLLQLMGESESRRKIREGLPGIPITYDSPDSPQAFVSSKRKLGTRADTLRRHYGITVEEFQRQFL